MKILGTDSPGDTPPGTPRSPGPSESVPLRPLGALQGRDVGSGASALRPGLVQRLLGCIGCARAEIGSGQLTPEAFAAWVRLLDGKIGRQITAEMAFSDDYSGKNFGDPKTVESLGYREKRRFRNLVESRTAIELELLAMLREINASREPGALIDVVVAVTKHGAEGLEMSKYQNIVTRMKMSLGVVPKNRPLAPPRPFHHDLLALYNEILENSAILKESKNLLVNKLFDPTIK